MKSILRMVKAIASMPLKAGFYALLIGLGVCLPKYGPALTKCGKAAITRLTTSRDDHFDPRILLFPEKELDLIRSVDDDVQSRLRRAQILIRKQQAEVEYLREKSRFIESHVPREENDARSAEQVLSQLAAAIEKGDSVSDQDRELFNNVNGPAWLALRNRSAASEESLQELLSLNGRIQFLRERLEKRRMATLQYVPVNHEERIPSADERTVVVPEIAEARHLLEGVHETLFKTVYALDPGLVREASVLERVSLAQ
jgi:hypothetical protein